jgi:hypothetical protein
MNESLYKALADETRASYNVPPLPYIYDKYLEFIATGEYPYNESVKQFIIKDLPGLSEHQIRNVLFYVYLASQVYHKVKEAKRRADLEAQGWALFSYDSARALNHGQRIIMHRKGHNILCQEVTKDQTFKVFVDSKGDRYLMKKGARTRGFAICSFIVPYVDDDQFFKTI